MKKHVKRLLQIVFTTRRVKLMVVFALFISFGYVFEVTRPGTIAGEFVAELEPSEVVQTDKDYSKFQHSNVYHSRLPCLVCHQRNDNSARIGFPGKSGHTPCAGCHTLQFADNSSPICTICHTSTGMKRFPGLKSFGARFAHDKHTRVNCSTCHSFTRQGVALSIPSGASAHSTCFRCHTASSSNRMASCSTCHQPGRLVRTPEWTRAYNVSFSHRKHLTGKNMSCATCHTVQRGTARGRQVSQPVLSMHFPPAGRASCGNCHNGQRAFGASEFANCKRCHQGNTFRF